MIQPMRLFRWGFLAVRFMAIFFAFTACHAQKEAAGTASSIFVVRHAEKADPSDPDTPLSPAGEARAQELARTLRDRGIDAIYATELQRTQQTARPLALALGLEVVVVNNTDRRRLLEMVRALGPGKSALIVGHNHTVPEIVSELSGEPVDGISENEFDNLYEVKFEADGRWSLVRSRYGAPFHR